MQRGWSVAGLVNSARTQNGHIRNDTRDVSRRISSPSNSGICRRNCVASDRACTRVTPRNLHGKEAVPGSSPGEGLNTCKSASFSTTEPLCVKEGLASRLAGRFGRGQKVPANR
jgi:hypothetical protein